MKHHIFAHHTQFLVDQIRKKNKKKKRPERSCFLKRCSENSEFVKWESVNWEFVNWEEVLIHVGIIEKQLYWALKYSELNKKENAQAANIFFPDFNESPRTKSVVQVLE